MELTFYTHSGFYCDGNGQYESIHKVIDLNAGTITTTKTVNSYGQLAGASQFAHSEDTTTETRALVVLDAETQRKVWQALEPLVSTYQKYPHLDHYRYFTRKYQYLIEGRFNKARKLAGGTDYLQYDSAGLWTWILPAVGYLVHAAVNRGSWTCSVEIIKEKCHA